MTKADIARNPLSAFLAKVSGVKLQGTRRRGLTPYQLWSKEQFATVRDDVDVEVEEESLSTQRGHVSKAQAHAIAAFNALPADERAVWVQRAREDQTEVARLKEEANNPLNALNPADTQVYVPVLFCSSPQC